jgi:hypothetical protein
LKENSLLLPTYTFVGDTESPQFCSAANLINRERERFLSKAVMESVTVAVMGNDKRKFT